MSFRHDSSLYSVLQNVLNAVVHNIQFNCIVLSSIIHLLINHLLQSWNLLLHNRHDLTELNILWDLCFCMSNENFFCKSLIYWWIKEYVLSDWVLKKHEAQNYWVLQKDCTELLQKSEKVLLCKIWLRLLSVWNTVEAVESVFNIWENMLTDFLWWHNICLRNIKAFLTEEVSHDMNKDLW